MGVSAGENGSPVLNRAAFKQKLESSERGRAVARGERKGAANEENASYFREESNDATSEHTERNVYMQFTTKRAKNRSVRKQ